MWDIFRGVRARREAENWCRLHVPDEPVGGSWIAESEPTRFVVRVFCGDRFSSEPLAKLPPWKICVIVAVDKTTFAASRIEDDEPYRPLLR